MKANFRNLGFLSKFIKSSVGRLELYLTIKNAIETMTETPTYCKLKNQKILILLKPMNVLFEAKDIQESKHNT